MSWANSEHPIRVQPQPGVIDANPRALCYGCQIIVSTTVNWCNSCWAILHTDQALPNPLFKQKQ